MHPDGSALELDRRLADPDGRRQERIILAPGHERRRLKVGMLASSHEVVDCCGNPPVGFRLAVTHPGTELSRGTA
jgi:hypothetical protein